MSNNNKESTRHFSKIQEERVAKLLGGHTSANSGAAKFTGGDVQVPRASLLCECKTVMTEKKSFSIKKDWIDKNKEEAFSNRLSNSCIAFSFEPEAKEVFFVINESMMQYLVEKIAEDDNL